MRTVIGTLAAGIALAWVGALLIAASRLDHNIALAQEHLVAQRYASADEAFEAAAPTLGYARWLPWIGNRAVDDMRARRAALLYWQHRYEDLQTTSTAEDMISGDNSGLQLVLANAIYRAARKQSTGTDATLEALDVATNTYFALLKAAPDNLEAAFNYEYLVRLRQEIEGGKGDPEQPFPEGGGSQGKQGSPPQDLDQEEEFLIYIPMEIEELDDAKGGAGKDALQRRKG